MIRKRTARVAVSALLALSILWVFEMAIMPLIVSPELCSYSTAVAPESAGNISEINDVGYYLPNPWTANPMLDVGYYLSNPWTANPFGYSPNMSFLFSTEWEIVVEYGSYCILGPVGSKFNNFWEAFRYGLHGNTIGQSMNFYGEDQRLIDVGLGIPILARPLGDTNGEG